MGTRCGARGCGERTGRPSGMDCLQHSEELRRGQTCTRELAGLEGVVYTQAGQRRCGGPHRATQQGAPWASAQAPYIWTGLEISPAEPQMRRTSQCIALARS